MRGVIMRKIDLTGKRFGRLVVQSQAENKGKFLMWTCLCDCGVSVEVFGSNLKNGHTKSCGCLNKEIVSSLFTTHGHTKNNKCSPEWTSWYNMRVRCYYDKHKEYSNYGGRGIKVCERWLGDDGFENFYEDMGPCPLGMTLERIDNEGDYCRENCKWATRTEQGNNKRNNVILTYGNETGTLSEWARSIGMNSETLRARIDVYGWDIADALGTKVMQGANQFNTIRSKLQ
jgi:hypothetical protein